MGRSTSTLIQSLFNAAESSDLTGNGIVFIEKGKKNNKLTYRQLAVIAQGLASSLKETGINRGEYVIFQVMTPAAFIKLFWGCLLRGAIPVPLAPIDERDMAIDKLQNILTILDPCTIITEGKIKELITFHLGSTYKIYDIEELGFPSKESLDMIPCDEEDLAYIQFSSGSTAAPKGICLTHKNICFNIEGMMKRFGVLEDAQYEKIIGWLPLTHNMGLIGMHLLPLIAKANQYLLTPQYLIQKPVEVFKLIASEEIGIMACPNFLLKWLIHRIKEEDMEKIDLHSIHTILMGAEPISEEVVRKFEEKFSKAGLASQTICCGYGMAEATLIVSLQPKGEGLCTSDVNGRTVVLNGSPLEGIEVFTVDEEGKQLPEGQVGELIVKAASVMKGYMGTDYSEDLKKGMLYTGDIGAIREGQLVILGRKKDLIIINGKNYYAHDIEQKIEALTQIPVEYFAIVSTLDKEKNEENIQLYVEEDFYLKNRMIIEAIEKVFEAYTGGVLSNMYSVEAIPRTVSGKKQRHLLNHINLRKQLVVHPIKEKPKFLTPLEETLCNIWQEVLGIDSIDINRSFFKLGGNSLAMMECLSKLHQQSLYISQHYFFTHPTIAQLAKKLEEGGEEIIAIQNTIIGEVKPLPNRYSLINQPFIHHWNFSTMIDIEPMPTDEEMEKVLRALIRQHDGLRHRIHIDGHEIHEWVVPVDEGLSIEWIHYNESCDIEAMANKYQQELSISSYPLKIIGFRKEGSKLGKLLFICHHALMDAYSANIFMEDFISFYKEIVLNNEPSRSYRKTTSVKEWSEVVNAFAYSEECTKDIEYWRNSCKKQYPIPYDYSWQQEDNRMKHEREFIFLISENLSDLDMKDMSIKLVGAWAQVIKDWCKKDEVVLQYTMNGRSGLNVPIDLSRTIGWIAFLVPLNIDLTDMIDADDMLKRVKKSIQSIPNGGISYHCIRNLLKDEVLLKCLQPEVTFNYYDVGNLTLLYENQQCRIGISKEDVGMLEHPEKPRGRVLDLVVRRTDDHKLYGKIHYSTKIHKMVTIEELAKGFKTRVLELNK